MAEPGAEQAYEATRLAFELGRAGTSEVLYAITDLPTHQARPEETAVWACEHWNHREQHALDQRRDFQRRRQSGPRPQHPAVMAALRDIICGTFRLTGWVNTASTRRAHTIPAATLALHGIP